MKVVTIGLLDQLDYDGAEAMNTICANLSFAGKNMKKILMTSCEAGDGKSFMTMQIAQNLARRGKRVVVVDTDLRRSVLLHRYRIETDGEWVGLAHYLAGYNSLDEIIYQTDIEDMCFIPIGRYVSNPIPLVNSPEFVSLLDTLAGQFDFVLVDTPPIGLVVDAAEIAQFCDGSILIVEYEKTRKRMMMSAKKQMLKSGCPLIGYIINKVSFDSFSSRKYYNKDYYSQYKTQYDVKMKPKKKRAKA